MGSREDDEAKATRFRAAELAENPVRGIYDAAHLREINRRLFQDMPGLGYTDVTPGEYRPAVPAGRDWYKARELEGQRVRPVVAYSPMNSQSQAEIDHVLTAADPKRLSSLDTDRFTKELADIYARLDYLHPFPDGNSRTLRTFTQQLADESGYDLDWSRFDQRPHGHNALYVARDLSVNRIAVDHVVSSTTRRDLLQTLDQLGSNPDLSAVLNKAVRSHRAIAFAELGERDAVKHFPDLQPAYQTLREREAYSLSKWPDKATMRQQFDASAKQDIQKKLETGTPYVPEKSKAEHSKKTPGYEK